MMRITVEIVPYGVEEHKYTIGRWDVFNKGPEAFGFTSYGVIEIIPEQKQAGMFADDITHQRQEGFKKLAKKVLKRAIKLENGQC